MLRAASVLIAFAAVCVVLGGQTTSQAGLIHHWAFDNTLNDSAGSNNGVFGSHTEGSGSVFTDGGTPSYYLFGKYGNALSLTRGEGVRVGDIDVAGNFTVSAWEYFAAGDPSNAHACLLQKGTSWNNSYGLLTLSSNGTVRAFTGGDSLDASGGGGGKWVHVLYTQSNTGRKLYVNGSLAASNAITTAPASNDYELWIGCGQFNFGGMLDDVAIWNHSLSTDEISNVYTLGATNYATPEPGAMVLLATGVFSLLAYAWRKRKSTAINVS